MRLFIAIDLPQPVVDALDRLMRTLRPAARIHWSQISNLHITTKFIGEWPDERLGKVEAALSGLPPHEPIPVEVRGLGWFPNARSPRVFWAGIHAPPSLAQLARDTEAALEPLGIAPEKRPFSPHLTLARIKEPLPLDRLQGEIAKLPSTSIGSFVAESFFLYRSQLRPGGSVYTKIEEYPLGRRS